MTTSTANRMTGPAAALLLLGAAERGGLTAGQLHDADSTTFRSSGIASAVLSTLMKQRKVIRTYKRELHGYRYWLPKLAPDRGQPATQKAFAKVPRSWVSPAPKSPKALAETPPAPVLPVVKPAAHVKIRSLVEINLAGTKFVLNETEAREVYDALTTIFSNGGTI